MIYSYFLSFLHPSLSFREKVKDLAEIIQILMTKKLVSIIINFLYFCTYVD